MRLRRVVGLICVLVPTVGRAAGFEFPDNGVQGLARGGAFTAKADDPSAIVYNVAGLAKLRGTHVLIDANFCMLSSSLARSGTYPDDTYLDATVGQVTMPWSGRPFPKVDNQVGVFPLPLGAVATDFGLRLPLTFAFGAYGPSSVGQRGFPEQVTIRDAAGNAITAPAPQRFELLDEDVFIVYPTFAVAWQPLPWLYLGGAFQWGIAHLAQHVYAMGWINNPNLCRTGEAYACQLRAGVDLWDTFTPTGLVAALARPAPHVEVGASVRLPFDANLAGDAELAVPASLGGIAINATGAKFTVKMPLIARFGGRYFFGPREDERGDVELDVTYETWSRIDTFVIDFATDLGTLTVAAPHNYRDTVSVRLGGAYNLKVRRGRLPLRAGFFYDGAAAPNDWSRLDFDAFTRFGFTGGAGYTLKGVTLNAALAFLYMPTRTVTTSQVTPIYALPGDMPTDSRLNGTFAAHQWVASIGASVSFAELLGRGRGLR
jgi:long-chain fatty acid transport protein